MEQTEQSSINDDQFEYAGSGGFTQCISGYGRNLIDEINAALDEMQSGDVSPEDDRGSREAMADGVKTLVGWCRTFNGKAQRLRAIVAKLPTTADGVPITPGMTLYCPRGHQNLYLPGGRLGSIYCCDGACWDDGCQSDSGSGTYYDASKGNVFSTAEAARAAKATP